MQSISNARKLFVRAWSLTLVLLMLSFSFVVAASGDLDTTFSGDGKVLTDIKAGMNNNGWAMAIQSDGKIVMVGDVDVTSSNRNVGIVRYTKAGVLDKSFNTTGKKIIDFGGAKDQGVEVVIEPTTQNIIVAGQKCNDDGSVCDVAVARLTPSGALDTTFNTTGIRIDDFGGGDNGTFDALVIQPDGKIVIGGYMVNSTTGNYDFAIYRYNENGSLDTTFNKTGKKSIAFGTDKNDYIYGIGIQDDGRIDVAGYTCDLNETSCNFALARVNSNGSLDTSFKSTGKVTTDFGGKDLALSLTIQPDGKIVVSGSKEKEGVRDAAIARYNTNGSLDTTFAGTGKKVIDISGNYANDWFAEVIVLPGDGKILVAGYSDGDFVLARFSPKGAFDTTFNSDGKLTIDFEGDDKARSIAVQPSDGKYVVAGTSNNGLYHYALARVMP